MSRQGRRSAALRLVVVVALAVVGLVLASSAALAAVTVSKTSLSSTGALGVEGRGAVPRAAVTVTSAESTARGTADRDGRFKVSATGYRSSDCRARVSDGSTAVTVTLSGCTPSSPPPSTVVITPDVAEIGPGSVGSDFTSTSATTTTMTLGPGALGPVRWEVVSGALPAGLGLVDPDPASTPAKSVHVSVTGTPTTVQVSTFTIRGTDANGLTATRTYTIRIGAAQTLTLAAQGAAPTLAVGAHANWWFEGSGGVRPYRWSVSAGQVPPGMSLVQDNPDGPLARVGGTPTTPGSYTFTLRLTDAQAGTASLTATLVVPQPASGTAALTVTSTGRSGERVTSSPTGLDVAVGSTGSAAFPTGTAVTLTASGGREAVWSGACSSGGSRTRSCTLTLGGPASVTASVQ